jgi:purine-binding chemotaxis protein CheW
METNGGTAALDERSANTGGQYNGSEMLQFATFLLDTQLYGIEVLRVQEVFKNQSKSNIPLAPSYVNGLINLRGQIVTLLDLRTRLGLPPKENSEKLPMNVVVNSNEGPVSLMVDEIGDVLDVTRDAFEPPPVTMHGKMSSYVHSVCKLEGDLLIVLDVDRLLEPNGSKD